MPVRRFLIIILICGTTGFAFAQQHRQGPIGTIGGYVHDSALNIPIEYASVILYSQLDSVQITGVITDRTGIFQLTGIRPGIYFIDVSFIGYLDKRIDNIEIRRNAAPIDLGDIPLEQTALKTDDVEFSIERSPVEYHIDKKVINVSKQPVAASGTAVDVLENIPSVTVDIEGNVSLRGSSNFRVLIDSRPTILESSDALQQIPASSIESIEIITNPSAKYDPDGTSGIINIIMIKSQVRGSGGIASLNYGLNDKYGGDFMLNYRKGIISTSFGADYNKRFREGTSRTKNYTTLQDTTSYYNSSGDSRRGRTKYGLRGTVDMNLTSADFLSLGGRWGWRSWEREAELDYDVWTEPGLAHSLYTSFSNTGRSGSFYSTFLEYRRQFPRKDHEITGRVVLSHRDGEEESTNELLDDKAIMTSGHKSTEEGPSDRVELKLDYTLPLQEKNKFELGCQSRISISEDITGLYQYEQGEYVFKSQFSHAIEYDRKIHSLYAIYSGEEGNFGYQGGLRGEYTYRNIELVGENNEFTIDRPDYYPSAHFSYRLSPERQVMASYTRRIERPRGWFLEPFITWRDAYNVRRGNPDLKPEYIDSCELGYQMNLGNYQFSTEAYYRVTDNLVEFVRSVYDYGVTMHSTENVGTEYTSGAELMLEGNLFNWWNVNCMVNLFNRKIEGVLFDEQFSQESNSWSNRFNNTFKMTKTSRLQINGNYNSPRVTSQGRREGNFVTNIALEKEFFERSLTAILQINDVFATGDHESISEGTNFYSSRYHAHEAPVVMLTIRYNINNYNSERRRDDRTENQEDNDDF